MGWGTGERKVPPSGIKTCGCHFRMCVGWGWERYFQLLDTCYYQAESSAVTVQSLVNPGSGLVCGGKTGQKWSVIPLTCEHKRGCAGSPLGCARRLPERGSSLPRSLPHCTTSSCLHSSGKRRSRKACSICLHRLQFYYLDT